MMRFHRVTILAVVLLGLATSVQAALTAEQLKSLPAPAAHSIDFKTEIKPIFEASCVRCHGRGRDRGGLQLDSRATLLKGGDSGPAVLPGHGADSYLIALVAGVDPDEVMPKKGSRLTAAQVGVLRAWIDQGLPWDPLIGFGPVEPLNLYPRLPKIPRAKEANPIDRFMDVYFRAHKIKPGKTVSDRLYARRVYLDTIGLLPPPGELEAFVHNHRANKRETLVNNLLARNEDYAQNWLSFWNDLLRNDYKGTGYIDGGRKQITRWLYSALATNMPYDQFVAELISPNPGSAGFIKGIVWRGTVNASETPQMQAAQNISQVFVGVNLKCASCHDSFINDWRLSDSYGLANVFSDKPLEIFECDKPTGKKAAAQFIFPQLGILAPTTNTVTRLHELAALVTGPKDGRLSRTIVNRLWAKFMGRGLIEPVDDMQQTAWNQDLLDWLAEDLVAHHYDLKQTMALILTSRAYQLSAVNPDGKKTPDFVFRGPEIRRMTAEDFRDALTALSGVGYAKAAAEVGPEFAVFRPGEVRAAMVPADPLMVALCRPNREQVVTTRATSATTLQALELTNGRTLAEVLKRGAFRMIGEHKKTKALVENVYEEAVGRKPARAELRLARNLLGKKPEADQVEDFLWAMVMLPEFQLIY